MYFVSSADATEVAEDAFSLFKLLDKVVEEIGEDNVVQVICFVFSSKFLILNYHLLAPEISFIFFSLFAGYHSEYSQL